LTTEVVMQDVQESGGAGVKGDGQEKSTFLPGLRVTYAETLHALDDFGVDISAEARFA
jgi:hypothetical protein